jgi:hypothetical protein
MAENEKENNLKTCSGKIEVDREGFDRIIFRLRNLKQEHQEAAAEVAALAASCNQSDAVQQLKELQEIQSVFLLQKQEELRWRREQWTQQDNQQDGAHSAEHAAMLEQSQVTFVQEKQAQQALVLALKQQTHLEKVLKQVAQITIIEFWLLDEPFPYFLKSGETAKRGK